jgi:hypothetical protein
MKILTNVLAVMLTSTIVTTYAQEAILASNSHPPKSGTGATRPAFEEAIEVIKAEAVDKEEEEEATFTFTGSVDAYFHTSFKTQNANYDDAYAPSTSFADLRGFSLGMVNLITSYAGEKAGFTADLVFGPRGRAAVFGTASGQAIINQAFMFYKFSDKATLNLGQFNTFVGYEVISPAANFHYSTSYLFSWGPFNHTGARLDLAFDKGIVAKLAVMNPTDIVEFNPVNTYTLGAQVGKTSESLSVWLNFLYGDQDGTLDKDEAPQAGTTSAGSLLQGDITLTYSLSDKVSLGFNASHQQTASGEQVAINGDIEDIGGSASSFTGFAVYPRLSLSENFALGLRAEYFAVKNGHLDIFGLDENGDGSVMEFTLSGNYKAGGLTFIPEIRVDKTSEDSFFEGTSAKSLMPSLTLAAVYKF